MTYRGVLLDFYGTVVDEDGPVIASIVRQITRERPEWSEATLAQIWGQEFSDLLAASHGAAFRTQRDLEIASSTTVLRTVASSLDPLELSADQFAYWQGPAMRTGVAESLVSCPVPVCGLQHRPCRP